MKKKLFILTSLCALFICLSACSNSMATNIDNNKHTLTKSEQESTSPSPSPSSVSLDKAMLSPNTPAPKAKEMETLQNDYFSLTYDKNSIEIIDNSNKAGDDEIKGCFYLMKNISGDPLTSIAHVDIFGSDQVKLPQNFSKESWEAVAKQIVASYYSEKFEQLNMAVYDTKISMDDPKKASTNISVKAIGTVPAINAKVCLQNGIRKSVIIVIVTYNSDTADMHAMTEALNTMEIK